MQRFEETPVFLEKMTSFNREYEENLKWDTLTAIIVNTQESLSKTTFDMSHFKWIRWQLYKCLLSSFEMFLKHIYY